MTAWTSLSPAKRTARLPLFLVAETSSVPVGGTARLLLHSGLSDQPMLFETFRGGETWERRWLEAGKDGGLLEIPVTEDLRGGFGARVTAPQGPSVRHRRDQRLRPLGQQRAGLVLLLVPGQARAGRPRDLEGHGQDPGRQARRRRRRGAPGLYVRPEPRPLRPARPAPRDGALSRPDGDGRMERRPGPGA